MDVNRDGGINAMDVLALINQINRTGPGYLKGSADSVQLKYDVSGDNYINSMDILRIINWMNREGVAEGEPSAKMDKNELAHGFGAGTSHTWPFGDGFTTQRRSDVYFESNR